MSNIFNIKATANSISTNWEQEEPLTLEKIMAAIKLIPPCPIKEYMIKKGYDPDKGWKMILPLSAREEMYKSFQLFPSYVQFSVLCGNYICFVHDSMTPKVMEYEIDNLR